MIIDNSHDHRWLFEDLDRVAILVWIYQQRLQEDLRQFDGYLVRAGETMFTQRRLARVIGKHRRTMQRKLADLELRGYVQKVHICRVRPRRNRGTSGAPHKCAASDWRGYCVYFVSQQVLSAVLGREEVSAGAPHRCASSLSPNGSKEGRRSVAEERGRSLRGPTPMFNSDPVGVSNLLADHPELSGLIRRIRDGD